MVRCEDDDCVLGKGFEKRPENLIDVTNLSRVNANANLQSLEIPNDIMKNRRK